MSPDYEAAAKALFMKDEGFSVKVWDALHHDTKAEFRGIAHATVDAAIGEYQLVSPTEGVEINWCVPHARGAYLFDGVIQCESIIFSPCQGILAVVYPLASSQREGS